MSNKFIKKMHQKNRQKKLKNSSENLSKTSSENFVKKFVKNIRQKIHQKNFHHRYTYLKEAQESTAKTVQYSLTLYLVSLPFYNFSKPILSWFKMANIRFMQKKFRLQYRYRNLILFFRLSIPKPAFSLTLYLVSLTFSFTISARKPILSWFEMAKWIWQQPSIKFCDLCHAWIENKNSILPSHSWRFIIYWNHNWRLYCLPICQYRDSRCSSIFHL